MQLPREMTIGNTVYAIYTCHKPCLLYTSDAADE